MRTSRAHVTSKVESDAALSKVVSIVRKSQKTRSSRAPPAGGKDRPIPGFFGGALPPSTGQAGQNTPRTYLRAVFPGKRNHRGVIRATNTPEVKARGSTSQNSLQRRRVHKCPNGSRTTRLVTSERTQKIGINMDLTLVLRERHTPVGGRLQFFTRNWEQVSQDPWVQETVAGCKLEFAMNPRQERVPPLFALHGQTKSQALDEELQKLAAKQAIERVPDHIGALFTSPMFLVAKADGSWRPVINLKDLNVHIVSRHFKMEFIRTAKGLLQEGDYMVKLDLKDAYLSVPLHSQH